MLRRSYRFVATAVAFALATTLLPAAAEANQRPGKETVAATTATIHEKALLNVSLDGAKAELTEEAAKQSLKVAQPAILPILGVILGIIVRAGLKHAIKVFGKTAVKKAFRQKLLARNSNTWHHIFQKGHNWHKFNAQGNRSRAADLLANAAANGKRYSVGRNVDEYRWVYQGKTIVAKVSKKTGEISDGWVK